MSKGRLYVPLKKNDLKQLENIALIENEAFFTRNPHLKKPYYNSLVGICLCQGAASHYINPKLGIEDCEDFKDFDIWYFYSENSNINFPYRARKYIENGYNGKSIDILRREISKEICDSYSNDPEKIIVNFLLEKNTKTKKMLLKKGVIGLFPETIFGKVMWKGTL